MQAPSLGCLLQTAGEGVRGGGGRARGGGGEGGRGGTFAVAAGTNCSTRTTTRAALATGGGLHVLCHVVVPALLRQGRDGCL
jgi:hypothetical protein